MTNEDCYKLLSQYNKWRRGKGRKYSQPGFPFDVKEIGCAIDRAVMCVKAVCKAQKVLDKKVEDEQTRQDS